MVKNILLFLIVIGTCLGCSQGSSDEGRKETTLNVYNWANYIGKETIANFEKEFDVHVNYDNFSNNEELLAKLQAGGGGYDIIFPSDYMVQIMSAQGLLTELDKEALPNIRNIDERFLSPSYDPDNKYCIPYHWGTAGVAVNTNKVHSSVTSWNMLWNPEYQGRISMLDDPRAGIIPALKKLGLPLNTTDAASIKKARDLLIQQKPLVKVYTSDTYPDLLRSEEIWIAHGYTGDIYQVIKDKPEIKYIIPDEGTELAVDSMCIPIQGKHKKLAHTFINYILRPDVAAAIANDIWYPSTNKAAREFINPQMLKDPNIYPPDEVMNKLQYQQDLKEAAALYDRAWSELKAK